MGKLHLFVNKSSFASANAVPNMGFVRASKNLDDAVTRMISDACDLGASIRARKNQRNRALRYLRIFVVNDALLFFLTTGRKILQEGYCESTEWSESTFQVELLRRDEEVAVDGWLALG